MVRLFVPFVGPLMAGSIRCSPDPSGPLLWFSGAALVGTMSLRYVRYGPEPGPKILSPNSGSNL